VVNVVRVWPDASASRRRSCICKYKISFERIFKAGDSKENIVTRLYHFLLHHRFQNHLYDFLSFFFVLVIIMFMIFFSFSSSLLSSSFFFFFCLSLLLSSLWLSFLFLRHCYLHLFSFFFVCPCYYHLYDYLFFFFVIVIFIFFLFFSLSLLLSSLWFSFLFLRPCCIEKNIKNSVFVYACAAYAYYMKTHFSA
jgi:hypothetical protein